ncbi:MAG: pyruvate dehydrogenase complex E1 component subunit beta [Victivallales bacterium]|nr:pyruvate dehydrogenase complex E1 component subunit beta [Victivallales bacterium]
MMKKNIGGTKIPKELKKTDLLQLYEKMVLLRRFESTAQDLYKKGVWPGFIHLYIGEEATAVGVCANLNDDDWITSTHRGHGHALAKGVPVNLVMAELFGKVTGCCGGRGGSMHLYYPPAGLLGTNGLVAGGIPLAIGAGLGAMTRGSQQVGVAFFGDGASNHGAFLESMNFAAVRKIPVIFVCENNLFATATPIRNATANTEIATRAAAFGLPGVAVDGYDVIDVYQAVKTAVERARRGEGPTLIESKTYRWCGHHEGDPVFGTYRTEKELNAWKERCPIKTFHRRLVEEVGVREKELDAIDARIEQEITTAVAFGNASADPDPALIHKYNYCEPINPQIAIPAETGFIQQTWLEAVRDGIAEEMRQDPRIIYLGEGIGERCGCFAHTKGLWEEFGGERVIDTPICELAFTGACTGAAATGSPAIADLMFADFLFDTGNQLVQQAAKLHYMSNGQVKVPLVVRAAAGMIKNAGAHHSGMYYPVWGHIPGLIVAVPSSPAEAKGLMKSAIRTQNPVVFLEHKAMFAARGPVPAGEYLIPLGCAKLVREGSDLTLVSCGLLVQRCVDAAEQLETQGLSCDVIDLRTIVPLDIETIVTSVSKTGRLLIVDEAWSMFGVGAEIAASMMERAFDELDAPVGRLHTERVSYPFSPSLESAVAVTVDKIIAAAWSVRNGTAPVPYLPSVDTAAFVPAPAPESGPAKPAASPPATVPAAIAPPRARPAVPAIPPGEVPITVPNMDLTVEEVMVVRWLKQPGDPVTAGEVVVEVESSKALMDIEAPASGILARILQTENAVVPLGQILGLIAEKRS